MRCKKKLLYKGIERQCGNFPTREGFCAMHTPEAIKRRKAKKSERVNQLVAFEDRQSQSLALERHKAACFDDLLAAAKETKAAWMPLLAHGYPELRDALIHLETAIAKAEGQ